MGVRQTVDIVDRHVVLVVGVEADFGELPGVEMLRCSDPAEATVWLEGSCAWSALVVDPRHGELMEAARRRGVPVADPNATDLPEFLRRRARPIRSAHDLGRCGAQLSSAAPAGAPSAIPVSGPASAAGGSVSGPFGGSIVSVCGPGGTGVSVVAMALAASLAAIGGPGVVLADLALRAGQAVLHQVAPTSVGLEELVHAYRTGRPGAAEIRDGTLALDRAGYRLLVGLHRPSHWTAVRPAAFDAALDGLRATFSVVVADVTGDLEGEAETGSTDVQERNHMARGTIARSDAVVVVGAPGPTGQKAFDATVAAVADHLGDATRTVRVLNGPHSGTPLGDVITVGRLSPGDDPAGWGRPVAEAVCALIGTGTAARQPPKPTLVAPGSIGQWHGAR